MYEYIILLSRIGRTIQKYISIAYNLGVSKDLRLEVGKGIYRKRDLPLQRIEVLNDMVTFFIYISDIYKEKPKDVQIFEYTYSNENVDKKVYREIISDTFLYIRFFPSRPLLNFILAQFYCSSDLISGMIYILLYYFI